MSLVRSLPVVLVYYLLAIVLVAGFAWIGYVCLRAIWEAFQGMLQYRSTLRIVLQGSGQLLLVLLLAFQIGVAIFVASIAVAKANTTLRYEWYVARGGDPMFFAYYCQDKDTWRHIAFRKAS